MEEEEQTSEGSWVWKETRDPGQEPRNHAPTSAAAAGSCDLVALLRRVPWSGSHLVQVWSRSGAGLEPLWSWPGPGLVPIWSRCGPGLYLIWCRCGPGLDLVWCWSGAVVVLVWTWSGAGPA